MARIANPDSKRDAVRRLAQDFGVTLPLEKVYRMMDRLDATRIEQIRASVADATEAVASGPLTVLFLDCTTLYFESVVEGDPEQAGPVVATALLDRLLHHAAVIQIEGASYRLRQHTELVPEHVRANAPISPPPPPKKRERPAKRKEKCRKIRLVTAVRKWGNYFGTFGEVCFGIDKAQEHQYIVGVRLRSLPQALKVRILKVSRYRRLARMEGGFKVGVFRYRNRRVVVSYSPKRARKDEHDRSRALARLLKKLKRSGQAKALVPSQLASLVRMKGTGRWELDSRKIREAARTRTCAGW